MSFGAPKTVTVSLFANVSQFEEAFIKAGLVAESTSEKIKGSAKAAGAAAATQAKQMGASADEQAAAAGRAAAAFTEANAKISSASRAAGAAAMKAAKDIDGSLEQQRAAYLKAIAVQSDYEASVKRSAEAAEAAAARQAKAAEKQAASMKKIGTIGKLGLGAAAVGVGFSVKGAADFQAAMERSHTQAGATQKQVGELSQKVLSLAPATAQGPDVLAQGMYHVVSALNATTPAAQRVSTEYKVLKVAAEGAKIGNASLVDTTRALNATVVAGLTPAHNYGAAMGELNAIVGAGDMTMQDLANALSTGVTGAMKTYGVSLKQAGAALAVFGDNYVIGQQAATKLASAMRLLASPSIAGSKALSAVGLSTLEIANKMRAGGLIPALEDLKRHLVDSGATAAQQAVIITRAFGGRQAQGILLLINQLDRLKAKQEQVGSGAKTFQSDWEATQKTLSFQFQQIQAQVETLGVKIGTALMPYVEDLIHAFQQTVDWFEKNSGVAKDLAVAIGTVLGGVIAVFVAQKIQAFVSGLGSMASAIGGLATKMATTATAFKVQGEAMVASADATEAGVDAALSSTGIGAVLVALSIAATEMATHWSNVMNNMKHAVNDMVSVADSALNKLIDGLNAAIGLFNSTIGQLTGTIDKVGKVGVGGPFNLAGRTTDTGPHAGGLDLTHGAATAARANIPGLSATQKITAGTVYSTLLKGGLSPAGASAIVGNWVQESGLNPNLTGASGLGMAQWMGGRRSNEMAFAKSRGLPFNSPVAQALFALQELQSSPGLLKQLQTTSNPRAAALAVSNLYERPNASLANNPRRESYAAAVYAALSGGTTEAGVAKALTSPTGLSKSALAKLGIGPKASTTTAAATSTIPVAVATMLATAQGLIGTRYVSGGGHGGWDPVAELKKIGVDCSGFVSQVLHAGGVSLPGPLTTQGLAANLKPGPGKLVTVYDRPSGSDAHTLIKILGKYFMSGGNTAVNPSGQVTQLTAAQAAQELAPGGFQAFHPTYSGRLATSKQLRKLGVSSSLGYSGTPLQNLIDEYLQKQLAAAQRAAAGVKSTWASDLKHAQSAAGAIKTNLFPANNDPKWLAARKKAYAEMVKQADAWQRDGEYAAEAEIKATNTRAAQLNRAAAAQATLRKAGNAAVGQLNNATQTGSLATLERRLGFSSGTLESVFHPGGGSPAGYVDRQSAGSRLTSVIAGIGNRATPAQIGKRLFGTVSQGLVGSSQEKAYEKQVEALLMDGQKKQAAALVAAHTRAIKALADETYAQQKEHDAKMLQTETQALSDQTTAIQNATSNWQTINQATEQRNNDAATAVVQHMQDMQQVTDDTMQGIATHINDISTYNSDTGQGIIDTINDQTQIQVDQIGERGLYGLNLITQELQVQADITKAYWDQQIDLAKQQVDLLQIQADSSETSAQVNLDQVTMQQDALVAQAQNNVDTATIAQDQLVAAAQAHADAVQLHTDTTLIGPAAIALDLNANASKSVQGVFQAQLDRATAAGSYQVGQANYGLAQASYTAAQVIGAAQDAFDTVNNTATYAIQSAKDSYQSTVDYFTNALADANSNLSTISTNAGIAEATIGSQVALSSAKASTEFAGSGLVVNVYNDSPQNAAGIGQEVSWAVRTSGLQTV